MKLRSVSSKAPAPRTRKPVDVDQLAPRVMAVCAEVEAAALGVFPGERELAARLGCSRHAVRAAIDFLEQQGAVKRLPGRGAISLVHQPPRPDDGTTLRCINFLSGPAHIQPTLQWLVQEYLTGYTQVLDHFHIKTRFLYWEDGRTDYESIFWPQAPRTAQGCVLMNRRDPELLGWLNQQQVPYAVQNHAVYDDTGLPPHKRVCVNKMGGAFEATRRLIEMGHRRIGFVGHLPAKLSMTPEYEGWTAALRCAGLTPRTQDTLTVDSEEFAPAVQACEPFFRSRADLPTAVISSHGAATVGIASAAEKAGLRIPQDLSIIGFDSNLTVKRPDLSLIQVPRHELARSAVELVLCQAMPHQKGPVESRILDCELLMRSSTAPPATGQRKV